MDKSADKTPNVATRFRQQIQMAKAMEFEVRFETLDDQTPSWCQVGKLKFIFLDVRASTREQSAQLEEILAQYAQRNAA